MSQQHSTFARTLLRAALPAALLGMISPAFGAAVIVNGNTALGINDEGHLNFFSDGPDGFNTYGVWRIGVGDATSPGCLCEGWGVAVTLQDGNREAGWASVDNGGIGGISGGTFGATPNTATSTVNFSGAPVTVTHAYGPSLAPDIFQAQVTITNTSATQTLQDVVYRRAMDWDVPPTEFNEYVTHQGVEANLESNGGNLRYASDNGFAFVDPRVDAGAMEFSTINTDFVDNGPSDHGSVFDFAFGDLAPGASRIFNIFYGTAANEANALAALAILNPSLYSLGQSTIFGSGGGGEGEEPEGPEEVLALTAIGDGDTEPGIPDVPANDADTFIFAFGGVGGIEPGTTPEVPVLPFVPSPGEFEFVSPPPGRWFDPPFVDGFRYALDCDASTPDCHFTEVGVPPASFGFGDVQLWIGGLVAEILSPGESFDFLANGFTSVTEFFIRGIAPLLDIADPGFSTAFPTYLNWAGTVSMLHMDALQVDVSEPGVLGLMGLGLLAMALRRRKAATASV